MISKGSEPSFMEHHGKRCRSSQPQQPQQQQHLFPPSVNCTTVQESPPFSSSLDHPLSRQDNYDEEIVKRRRVGEYGGSAPLAQFLEQDSPPPVVSLGGSRLSLSSSASVSTATTASMTCCRSFSLRSSTTSILTSTMEASHEDGGSSSSSCWMDHQQQPVLVEWWKQKPKVVQCPTDPQVPTCHVCQQSLSLTTVPSSSSSDNHHHPRSSTRKVSPRNSILNYVHVKSTTPVKRQNEHDTMVETDLSKYPITSSTQTCHFCEHVICHDCTKTCQVCHYHYCSFCSTTNQYGDVSVCLDCQQPSSQSHQQPSTLRLSVTTTVDAMQLG